MSNYDEKTITIVYADDAQREKVANVLGCAPYGQFFAYRGRGDGQKNLGEIFGRDGKFTLIVRSVGGKKILVFKGFE